MTEEKVRPEIPVQPVDLGGSGSWQFPIPDPSYSPTHLASSRLSSGQSAPRIVPVFLV